MATTHSPLPLNVPFSAVKKDQSVINQWQWQCRFCTYVNTLSTDLCEKCNNVRMYSLSTCKENHNVKRLKSITNQSAKEWTCKTCTYSNSVAATMCDMCEKPRSSFVTDILEQEVIILRSNNNGDVMQNETAGVARNSTVQPISTERLQDAQIPTPVLIPPSEALMGNILNQAPASASVLTAAADPTDASTSAQVSAHATARPPSTELRKAIAESNVIIPSLSTLLATVTENDNQNNVVNINNDFLRETQLDPVEKIQNYVELETYHNTDLVICLDHFVCTVCLSDYYPGEGITLKDCLHTFCRECLVRAVKCNAGTGVKCPYGDDRYQCTSKLQDREIKALVGAEAYENFLNRSVKEAEPMIENAFHCMTANCEYWFIFEGSTGVFACPVCGHTNCMGCKAIHDDMSCEDYQLKILNDGTNRASKEYLEGLLNSRTARRCPRCKAVITKYGGCDNMICTACKLSFRWSFASK